MVSHSHAEYSRYLHYSPGYRSISFGGFTYCKVFPVWPVSQSFTFIFCQWLVAVALQLSVVVGRPQVRNVYRYVYVSRPTVYRYVRSYDYTLEILSLVNST